MSRIGKKPVILPQGVEVTILGDEGDKKTKKSKNTGDTLTVKGSKGVLSKTFSPQVSIYIEKIEKADNSYDRQSNSDSMQVVVKIDNNDHKALHGLTRSLIYNMVYGVSVGFEKELKLIGVGYRAQVKGTDIHLNLGFSHPVIHPLPQGIKCTVEKNTELKISGIDKELVGQVCADIKKYRPTEPYHGKGIRYKDEHISLKAGKSAKK